MPTWQGMEDRQRHSTTILCVRRGSEVGGGQAALMNPRSMLVLHSCISNGPGQAIGSRSMTPGIASWRRMAVL
jgi:hypothetical protein